MYSLSKWTILISSGVTQEQIHPQICLFFSYSTTIKPWPKMTNSSYWQIWHIYSCTLVNLAKNITDILLDTFLKSLYSWWQTLKRHSSDSKSGYVPRLKKAEQNHKRHSSGSKRSYKLRTTEFYSQICLQYIWNLLDTIVQQLWAQNQEIYLNVCI